MPLSDTAIRTTKPRSKPFKLFDSGGLYLIITPTGSRWWRFDYRYAGKRKTLSLGIYPAISLKDARGRRDELRRLLANDVDPGAYRKQAKAQREFAQVNSLEVAAHEWYAKHAPNWAQSHAIRVIRRLELDVFP